MRQALSIGLLMLLAAILGSCASKKISGSDQKTIIVDVRTEKEWVEDGHAACTVNYPLNKLADSITLLSAYDKVVVVCRSGRRSETAKQMLLDAGIKNVENKGSWKNINCKE